MKKRPLTEGNKKGLTKPLDKPNVRPTQPPPPPQPQKQKDANSND